MEMAKLYIDEEFTFGPVVVSHLSDDYDTLSEEEKVKAKRRVNDAKDMITKGQKRVMEKVKEIRQFLESYSMDSETTDPSPGSSEVIRVD